MDVPDIEELVLMLSLAVSERAPLTLFCTVGLCVPVDVDVLLVEPLDVELSDARSETLLLKLVTAVLELTGDLLDELLPVFDALLVDEREATDVRLGVDAVEYEGAPVLDDREEAVSLGELVLVRLAREDAEELGELCDV